MSSIERFLATSRRTRRHLIYKLVKSHCGELGITTDHHGRGLIFHPGELDGGATTLDEAARRTEDRLAMSEIPAGIVRLVAEDNDDFRAYEIRTGRRTQQESTH